METHISWVFIASPLVFKIKKPVNLGFLDFSTLEKRHDFCQLELELRSGELYQYFDVPPQTHAELMAADSKGEYFNANIRNCFPFQQIRRASATTPDTF